ncbi:hypothetical protein TRIUR3_26525 [Triticum urartu]|uniref:Uncharacterized protein n=1 Tax=Triticum urartu TaxID=4572 RepID=M8A7C0_TRIUA|nr:hypothetical protein TRIUR3_26525 [Triticum urartu]
MTLLAFQEVCKYNTLPKYFQVVPCDLDPVWTIAKILARPEGSVLLLPTRGRIEGTEIGRQKIVRTILVSTMLFRKVSAFVKLPVEFHMMSRPADLSVLIFPGFVFCDRALERLHLDGRSVVVEKPEKNISLRSEGFAVEKLIGLSTPNNGVGPLTCGFCWYQEKEVPFNLQELCQWQRAFLDNDVVLHVRNMQRVKSAQEGILQAAPNPILWDREYL